MPRALRTIPALLLGLLLLDAYGKPGGVPTKHAGPGLARAQAATVAIEIVGHDANGAWISHAAGTVLHEAGYVLTCEHVTAHGERQSVVLADGRRFPFRVLARAGGSFDLAVLVFEAPEGLQVMEWGRSQTVAVDDKVMLVGNPGGKGLRVLAGIIDRPDCGGGTQLQVRAADVSPGYSGGPVLDGDGRQVAHIHVAIRSAPNISRHIKVDHARHAFATRLQQEEDGEPLLGVRVDCDGEVARVIEVRKHSAAARAGLAAGDVITRAGTLEIRNGIHWVLAARDRAPTEPLRLRVRRGDVEHEVKITP
jgi:S1-C subfamily serine protease